MNIRKNRTDRKAIGIEIIRGMKSDGAISLLIQRKKFMDTKKMIFRKGAVSAGQGENRINREPYPGKKAPLRFFGLLKLFGNSQDRYAYHNYNNQNIMLFTELFSQEYS
mgnify:FL=1